MIFVKRLIVILTFALFSLCLFGQENNKDKSRFKESESFLRLPNGEIKNEIALFNIKSSDSLKKIQMIQLEEIPLKRCTDSSAIFMKGNIWGDECVVAIQAVNTNHDSRIGRMFYGMYKYVYWFPDSAINDIYNPIFCTEYTKKNKPLSSHCRVFQTMDKRRIYIYMINGEGDNRYEITWVYQDNDYYTRVIDCL